MTGTSDYAENILADHLVGNFGGSPTEVYLALFTTDPLDDASGDEVEFGGSPTNGYARKAITFSAAVGGVAASNVIATFTAAGDSWGLITHIALFDSPSGGNMLSHGALGVAQQMADEAIISFAAGGVTYTQT